MYRGREKAVIYPVAAEKVNEYNLFEDPAFGIWKSHKKSIRQTMKELRKPRHVI